MIIAATDLVPMLAEASYNGKQFEVDTDKLASLINRFMEKASNPSIGLPTEEQK